MKPIYVVLRWSNRFQCWHMAHTYSQLLPALRFVHITPRTRLVILRGENRRKAS